MQQTTFLAEAHCRLHHVRRSLGWGQVNKGCPGLDNGLRSYCATPDNLILSVTIMEPLTIRCMDNQFAAVAAASCGGIGSPVLHSGAAAATILQGAGTSGHQLYQAGMQAEGAMLAGHVKHVDFRKEGPSAGSQRVPVDISQALYETQEALEPFFSLSEAGSQLESEEENAGKLTRSHLTKNKGPHLLNTASVQFQTTPLRVMARHTAGSGPSVFPAPSPHF
ncbi:hypothetical protein NDU88_004199 [Pleurodeles waltl]|uniref:Uncharacterized protein n=1 Tax=Pleurodeles waltl TaxID=8319 RepID=A0AAV7RHG7_PLEWA|nr:hypothetical protein NDU88_004199 [Pleurodeles waltl]